VLHALERMKDKPAPDTKPFARWLYEHAHIGKTVEDHVSSRSRPSDNATGRCVLAAAECRLQLESGLGLAQRRI
jgi:hypothetical protein